MIEMSIVKSKTPVIQQRGNVLGLPVDLLDRKACIKVLSEWLEKDNDRPYHIVTAYSEFFVKALADGDFGRVIRQADLVVADGVSVLAAIRYDQLVSNSPQNAFERLLTGLTVGIEILNGKIGQPVTGVWLFEQLVEIAAGKGYRVMLLGGYRGVATRLKERLSEKYPKLVIEAEEGLRDSSNYEAADNIKVIEKINERLSRK